MQPDSSEWAGEAHVLTVHSVRLPDGPFDDGGLEYDIKHPESCTEEGRDYSGVTVMEWACELAFYEREAGLASALRYSGCPIAEPGIYRIQSWGRKYYVWDYGAYEYDAGIAVMPDEEPQSSSNEERL
jgi:hypothetical protein